MGAPSCPPQPRLKPSPEPPPLAHGARRCPRPSGPSGGGSPCPAVLQLGRYRAPPVPSRPLGPPRAIPGLGQPDGAVPARGRPQQPPRLPPGPGAALIGFPRARQDGAGPGGGGGQPAGTPPPAGQRRRGEPGCGWGAAGREEGGTRGRGAGGGDKNKSNPGEGK